MSRSAARVTRSPQPEPFYGWRYVKKVLPDGRVDLEGVPLTLEDLEFVIHHIRMIQQQNPAIP